MYPAHPDHVVRSSGAEIQKLNFDDFQDEFPAGDKNCYDCKNFVLVNVRTDPDNPKRKIGEMKCKLGVLVIGDYVKQDDIREPVFLWADDLSNLWRYKQGYRNKHWNYANRCEDFDDMREESDGSENNN